MAARDTADLPPPQHHGDDKEEALEFPFTEVPEPGQLLPIDEKISWLRMPLPFQGLDHINLYVLDDGEAYTLVDSGLATDEARAIWRQLFDGPLSDKPVGRIVITHFHPDHAGLAGWLSDETGAPIWMTRNEFFFARTFQLDATPKAPEAAIIFFQRAGFSEPAIEKLRQARYDNYARATSKLPLDYRRLKEGDQLQNGARNWTIRIGSGHSPEHACLYEAEAKILISGDQILPRITSNVGVYPGEPYANPLADWLDSIERFSQLPETTLVLPAHHDPFIGLRKRLDEIRGSHIRRLKSLSAHCKVPCSAIEAFPVLFKRRLKGMDFILATAESLAHLHYLEAGGYLERHIDGPVHRFQTVRPYDNAAGS
jgi:glyoxylase-like metal-dependent hydrolase (beta-lactamase superfamily II)